MVKILVIEDEESIRRLIRYDLRVSGYEVDSEEDGLKGLDKALNIKYDVIVIDWMLPGLDGLSIVKELRNNRVDSIIIMLTAKDQETDILESFEAGVDDYITKPFSPRQLQARIKAHLKRVIVTTTVEETIGNLSLNSTLR